jgi:hypothetical protein
LSVVAATQTKQAIAVAATLSIRVGELRRGLCTM